MKCCAAVNAFSFVHTSSNGTRDGFLCVCVCESESGVGTAEQPRRGRAHSARIYNNECANWRISVFVLPLNRAVSNRIHIGLRIHALRRPRRDWLK